MQYSSPRVRRVFLPVPLTEGPGLEFSTRASSFAARRDSIAPNATVAPSVRSIRATVTFTEEPVQREKEEKLVR